VATEGYRAIREGRWADAVDRFKRAESLVHAPPHLLYLARAYAKLGQLVESHETYQKLTRETLAPGAPAVFASAQADGAKELAALETRLPTLRIDVPPSYTNLVVTLDGEAVLPALVGLACPVNPGDHKLRATADGAASDVVSVSVAEGAHSAVAITLKSVPSAAKPVAGAPPGRTITALNVVASEPQESRHGSGGSGLRIGGIAALAIGVVGVGVGAGFAVASHSQKSQGDALCTGGQCPVADLNQISSLNSAATRDGTIAVSGFIVGGVGAILGATLLVLSGKNHKEVAATATVSPFIGLGSAGVEGRF
jgi:hypothetical protein